MAATTYKRALINAASSGSNTLVSAVATKKIRVHMAVLVGAGAVTAQFKTAASGSALSGAMSLITGTPLVLPFNELGYVETVAGDLLNLVLGGAVQVSGVLTYSEV